MVSMTRKELKKLSRAELLELLLTQIKENERLRSELLEANQLLRDRHIKIEKAGDLATAVLAVNGVIEAAQAAAQQYLENMADMERSTQLNCKRMIAKAEIEAAKIRNQAVVTPDADELVHSVYELLGNNVD